MDDPALFMPHLEFTQNLGLTPGLGWVGETSLAHRARDVSPKGGHTSQATPVAALAPHPCSRAIHPSIQPLAVPPCAGGLPCGPIGVTENLRRKPRATGYLHLYPTSHAALSPAPLKHPHDRALQTPTPCGILPHKPSRPARRDTFTSLPHEPRRPQSPPLSSTPRPRPTNTHAVRNPPRATRRPARRDTFTSTPYATPPRPRDKALHISLRPPLMRANAPGL